MAPRKKVNLKKNLPIIEKLPHAPELGLTSRIVTRRNGIKKEETNSSLVKDKKSANTVTRKSMDCDKKDIKPKKGRVIKVKKKVTNKEKLQLCNEGLNNTNIGNKKKLKKDPPTKKVTKTTATSVSKIIPVTRKSMDCDKKDITPKKGRVKKVKEKLTNMEKLRLCNEVARAQLVKNVSSEEVMARVMNHCGLNNSIGNEKKLNKNPPIKKVIKRRATSESKIKNNITKVKKNSPSVKKKVKGQIGIENQPLKKLNNKEVEDNMNLERCGLLLEERLRSKSDISGDRTPDPYSNQQSLTFKRPDQSPRVNHYKIRRLSNSSTSISLKSSKISDTYSWTKDISSSSTSCKTVTSNDFVRIDRKLPIIKINDINYELSKNSKLQSKIAQSNFNDNVSPQLLSESDTVSDAKLSPQRSIKCKRDCIPISETKRNCRQTNSTNSEISSSRSLTPHSSILKYNTNVDKTSKNNEKVKLFDTLGLQMKKNSNAMESKLTELRSTLNSLDIEFINWLGSNINKASCEAKELSENASHILKEEIEIIKHCQNIKQYLPYSRTSESTSSNTTESDSEDVQEDDIMCNDQSLNTSKTSCDYVHRNSVDIPLLTIENVANKSADQVPEPIDDDCISLYAESMSGLETIRMNTSVFTNNNKTDLNMESEPTVFTAKEPSEPLRLLLKNQKPSTINIEHDFKSQNTKTKIVCEKQNADSTSLINKEEKTSQVKVIQLESLMNVFHKDDNAQRSIVLYRNYNIKLSHSRFLYRFSSQSAIFTGICFYNLTSICRNTHTCRFKHKFVCSEEVSALLSKVNNNVFLDEYYLLINSMCLTLKYVHCFFKDCIRRDLPRLLIEIAVDIVTLKTSPNKNQWKVEQLENILLEMNNIKDIDTCEDLLQYKFADQTYLCDKFIKTISDSQNFSRFKCIFIKLINAIAKTKRLIDVNVTTQILERICILSPDSLLVSATLKMIFNTDPSIFDNSHMNKFQMILADISKELYNEFVIYKESMVCGVIKNSNCTSDQVGASVKEDAALAERSDSRIYNSPDTTNLDCMKKNDDDILKFRQHHSKETLINPSIFNSNESCQFKNGLRNTDIRQVINTGQSPLVIRRTVTDNSSPGNMFGRTQMSLLPNNAKSLQHRWRKMSVNNRTRIGNDQE